MILERKHSVEEIKLRQKTQITPVTSGVHLCESDETSFKNIKKNSKRDIIWK